MIPFCEFFLGASADKGLCDEYSDDDDYDDDDDGSVDASNDGGSFRTTLNLSDLPECPIISEYIFFFKIERHLVLFVSRTTLCQQRSIRLYRYTV